MIKAYRILSVLVSAALYALLAMGILEVVFDDEEYSMHFSIEDVLVVLIPFLIASLILTYTYITRKIHRENFKHVDLIDNLEKTTDNIPEIKYFQLLGIINFLIGLASALTFLIVLLTEEFDLNDTVDGLLPVLVNLILIVFGLLQMNYVLKTNNIYNERVG